MDFILPLGNIVNVRRQLVPLVVALATVIRVVPGANVTFYQHYNYKGDSLSLNVEGLGCINLPNKWNDKTSSLSAHDNCVIAYESKDCSGTSHVFSSDKTNSADKLAILGFNDKLTSFRMCPPKEQTCRQVKIDVDVSKSLELAAFGKTVQETLQNWYPFACRFLWSPDYEEVDHIQVKFDPDLTAKIKTDMCCNVIVASSKHYKFRQDDVGSLLHEMVHLIQRYKSWCGWIYEGIADTVRWWYFEPNRPGKPEVNKGNFENQSPVYFLNWVDGRYPNTLYWINKSCRDGTYKKTLWQNLTSHTPEQLWAKMLQE